MATPTLSVVMPVYNEAEHLPATLEALVRAVEGSGFRAELVLVDDGSTDGSSEVARGAVADRMPVRLIRQPNRGRLEARRAGLRAATGEWSLLLDGRVEIDAEALSFVREQVLAGRRVWTAHVHVRTDGNVLAIFWKLIAELAWSEYFDRPRTTSFGAEEFDRFPKGTTCFLGPTKLLGQAMDATRSRYSDLRLANDDTPVIRWIAKRERVHISPSFAARYQPRTSLRSFLARSFHRGIVFLDGHGHRESRLFPVAMAFYPLSVLAALGAARRRGVLVHVALFASLAGAALGVRRRRSPLEVASLALVTPLYAIAHGLGMWRGLAAIVGGTLQRR